MEQAESCKKYVDALTKRATDEFVANTKIDAKTLKKKGASDWYMDENEALEKGVIDFAINLIDFDDEYLNAFYYAVGETLVVEDRTIANKLIGKYRMVTLSGDLFEKSGSITDLQQQVKYVLLPAQYRPMFDRKAHKWKDRCVEREVCYVADFVYEDEHGNQVVEDKVYTTYLEIYFFSICSTTNQVEYRIFLVAFLVFCRSIDHHRTVFAHHV